MRDMSVLSNAMDKGSPAVNQNDANKGKDRLKKERKKN
jgi:hypothetical protein